MTPALPRRLAGILAAAVAARRSSPRLHGRPGPGASTSGPSPAPAASASGRGRPARRAQPAALGAGETRTVTMHDREGHDRHQARGRPVADRGRQLRGPRGLRLLRRRRLPPSGARVRDPGRRSDAAPARGGPGYTIADEPVTTPYGRGTVAMARTQDPNSVGSQFFIVLDDGARAPLEQANTYQIIGTVTSGMDDGRCDRRDAEQRRAGQRGAPARPDDDRHRSPTREPGPTKESRP